MKQIKLIALITLLIFCHVNTFAQKKKKQESPTYQGTYQKNNNKLHKHYRNRNYRRPGTSIYYNREN